jgi:hypothetical protein
MRPGRAIGATTLLIAATAALAACGNSGALDKRETIETVRAICGDATRRARAFAKDRPPATSPAAVSAAVAEDVRIARQVEERLRKLDLADAARPGFDRFVEAQARVVKANSDQLAASQARDPVRFRASVDALLAATGDSKKAADAYGLRDCPYLPVAVQLERRTASQAPHAGGSASGGIVGRWTGDVTQYGPGQKTERYPTVMTVTADEPGAVAGTIRYPSLGCGGELQLRGTEASRHIYREHITSGRKRCYDGGTIFASVSRGSMSWRWVGSGNEVVGVLRRQPQ